MNIKQFYYEQTFMQPVDQGEDEWGNYIETPAEEYVEWLEDLASKYLESTGC